MLRPLTQLFTQPAARTPRPAAAPAPAATNNAPVANTPAGDTIIRSRVTPGEAPDVAHEFRGGWIATVQNIDWPAQPGEPADKQKAELIAMLDKAQAAGLNAVMLQVRSYSDALYPSKLEPFSPALSGKMGGDPGYDPLQFAIDEAHKRGLQLHAWFNPYRAGVAGMQFSADHITKQHPDWIVKYGNNIWLDPSKPQVQSYIQSVIMDVVNRYDIDGVHMDDYFYPYPVTSNGHNVDFPDAKEYALYQAAGGKLSKDDWRRDNINRFVQGTTALIHGAKPDLQFGISPFGIWRAGNPPGIKGLGSYDDLYADATLWMKQGWVDYMAPQLYWPIEKPAQSFTALAKWWADAAQNPLGRHMYPGLSSSSVGTSSAWPASQITRQIDATRQTPGADGNIHFSMKALTDDQGGVGSAVAKSYAAPALAPASPWLDAQAPDAPTATLTTNRATGTRTVQWTPADEKDVFQWVVASRKGGQWTSQIYPADKRTLLLPEGTDALEIAAVDRSGNESQRARLDVS